MRDYSFSQQYIHWVTNSEIGVKNYEVQQSTDTVHWTVLATVTPTKKLDSNKYSYPLPFVNAYIRVNANMLQGNYYTPNFLLASVLSVIISNISIQNRVLQWTTSNEGNVKYYSIQESTSGNTWYETQQVLTKGDSQYKVTIK